MLLRSSLYILKGAAILYVSWLAMMALHELGHVLHVAISGGKVADVSLPLLGFSRTDLSIYPHPQFVAWGGPIWGSLIPLLLVLVLSLHSPGRKLALFFVGFCLITNGAYIGIGAILPALFGLLPTTTGLYLWHFLTTPRATAFTPPS